MPRELPILMCPEMVRAILEGRMTQFREVIICEEMRPLGPHGCMWPYRRGKEIPDMPGVPVWEPVEPRYRVGDELWVQEKIRFNSSGGAYPVTREWIFIEYAADRKMRTIYFDEKAPTLKGGGKNGYKWHSSRVMYKWAARLWLRVTAVKDPHRLQDISEEDAVAEGIQRYEYGTEWAKAYGGREHNIDISIGYGTQRLALSVMSSTAQSAYGCLWDRLHPKPGERWEDNPWHFTYKVERFER